MRPFCKRIGCIMYFIASTCPDLAYSVCTLAKLVKTPTPFRSVCMQRVLKYIFSTKHFGSRYAGPGQTLVLSSCSDTDWADDGMTRKSGSGWCLVMMGGAVVSFIVQNNKLVTFLVLKLRKLAFALASSK